VGRIHKSTKECIFLEFTCAEVAGGAANLTLRPFVSRRRRGRPVPRRMFTSASRQDLVPSLMGGDLVAFEFAVERSAADAQ